MSAAAAVPAVRERPILFSGPMVKAILAETKTQTRRVMNPQPIGGTPRRMVMADDVPEKWQDCYDAIALCPYGVPGQRLWVRETWQCFFAGTDIVQSPTPRPSIGSLGYAATDAERVGEAPGRTPWPGPWRPSIFMPRWASRLTLDVTEVRVQRLQEITEEDARAEGVEGYQPADGDGGATEGPAWNRIQFSHLWDAINGKRAPWTSNPWVWCVSFRGASWR